jgi:hypothetical protein
MIPPVEQRPRCSHKNCSNPRAIIGTLSNGSPNYRKVCGTHHGHNIAKKNGVKSSQHLTAKRKGMTISEYKNSTHPYRQHRKDYCENKDGRLGYICRAVVRISAQLEVDHKNGNPTDNRPRNLQTLCCLCHKYKTYANKDYRSPGRKQLNG